MTDVYCQINKMRLQKVANNEHLVLGDAYTLTTTVTFRSRGRIKLVTGTPKKGPKMVFAKDVAWDLGVVWAMMDNGNKGCVLAFKLRSHEPDPSPLSNRMENARPLQTVQKPYQSV